MTLASTLAVKRPTLPANGWLHVEATYFRPHNSNTKVFTMKHTTIALLIASLFSVGAIGCSEKKASTKQETMITTPGGTTTVTIEKEVKKTGKNPPSSTP